MKVIFLDIDGVLNCETAYKSGECNYVKWYWHGNPNIYTKDAILGRGFNKYTAEHKWKTDSEKERFAINAGYNILIIWESNFNKDKSNILNKLL